MTSVIDLLAYEEGFRAKPYVCSEGYPTVGYGFKLGPRILGPNVNDRCQHLYNFVLPRDAADVWLATLIIDLRDDLATHPRIGPALREVRGADGYTPEDPVIGPREAILISMAFQMGIDGLAAFRQTLLNAQARLWGQVATQMLKSRWANQTPKRARRHARQMETGQWDPVYAQEA